MLKTRRVVRRGLLRSINQVAISVLATLIATSIYAGLRQEYREVAAPTPAPVLTSGGKLASRIDGAASVSTNGAPPSLSIVNWAITARTPTGLVDDIGWDTSGAPAAPSQSAVTAKPVRVTHDVRRIAAAVADVLPPARPAALPQLDLHTAPPADRPDGLWDSTTTAARSLITLTGAAIGRLIP